MKWLIATLIIVVVGTTQQVAGQEFIRHDITVTPGPDLQGAADRMVAGMEKLAERQKVEEEQRRQDAKDAIEWDKKMRQFEQESQDPSLEQPRHVEAAPLPGSGINAELESKRKELEQLEQEIQKRKSALKSDVQPLMSNGERICNAAIRGDLTEIKQLLLTGADVNTTNSFGQTALIEASRRGYYDICRLLIENGADVNLKDGKGTRALIEAVSDDYYDICRLLIEKGADVNAMTENEYEPITPLMEAASRGHLGVCRLLIENGADVNVISNGKLEPGKTALFCAAIGYRDGAIAELLIKNGADVNARIAGGWTPLMFAAGSGMGSTVEALLHSGADVNARDNEGRTALTEVSRGSTFLKEWVIRILKNSGATE